VDDLPEAGDEVQPGPDRPAYGLDPEAAGRLVQVGTVEEREGADGW
jgi:hypothetical protein